MDLTMWLSYVHIICFDFTYPHPITASSPSTGSFPPSKLVEIILEVAIHPYPPFRQIAEQQLDWHSLVGI